MTYGWAILVVLASIGALAYFGVLSPKNIMPIDSECCELLCQEIGSGECIKTWHSAVTCSFAENILKIGNKSIMVNTNVKYELEDPKEQCRALKVVNETED